MCPSKTPEMEEMETAKFLDKESMYTILAEGFGVGFSKEDPVIISLRFLTVPSKEGPLVFSDVGLTLYRAKGLVSALQDTIKECEENLAAKKD